MIHGMYLYEIIINIIQYVWVPSLCQDASKFLSGALSALTAMVNLELCKT